MVPRQNAHPQRRKQVSEQTWTCPGAPKSDCDCDQCEMGDEVSREIVVPQNEGCSDRRRDRSNSQSITRHNSECRPPGQLRNAPKGHTLKSLTSCRERSGTGGYSPILSFTSRLWRSLTAENLPIAEYPERAPTPACHGYDVVEEGEQGPS